MFKADKGGNKPTLKSSTANVSPSLIDTLCQEREKILFNIALRVVCDLEKRKGKKAAI